MAVKPGLTDVYIKSLLPQLRFQLSAHPHTFLFLLHFSWSNSQSNDSSDKSMIRVSTTAVTTDQNINVENSL